VRWRVALRMVIAWVITLPAAALVGAVMWWLGSLVGGAFGGIVMFVILLTAAALIYLRSRRNSIGAHNVNDEWQDAGRSAKQKTNA
jgi:PiT family inorganic phosphate transporter